MFDSLGHTTKPRTYEKIHVMSSIQLAVHLWCQVDTHDRLDYLVLGGNQDGRLQLVLLRLPGVGRKHGLCQQGAAMRGSSHEPHAYEAKLQVLWVGDLVNLLFRLGHYIKIHNVFARYDKDSFLNFDIRFRRII